MDTRKKSPYHSSPKDFRLMQKLGTGSFSSVYMVKRHKDCKIYAMKKVKMDGISEKNRSNALNEIRILASIRHPYVVGYKDSFIDTPKNTLNIIMDYCPEGDLYQKILKHKAKDTRFSETALWDLFGQLVLAVDTLHRMNIYHRDIKCANVLLARADTPDGLSIKLGDLNVSKIVGRARDLTSTQTGTPLYKSPEIWREQPYDGKCDIWSIGVAMFECMHLAPPFLAETVP